MAKTTIVEGDELGEAWEKQNTMNTELYDGQIPFIEVTDSGDDMGLVVSEQFSVGKPGDGGKESVFGEGDSYPVPIAYHCQESNTTGMVITSAVDITTILQSDSSSSTGLFGGTTAGAFILVGSDYKFGGIKAKIDTPGIVGYDQVSVEYLADTDDWSPAAYMVTDSDYPYTQYGSVLSSSGSGSEQWRFGFDPLDLPVQWVPTELTVNGVAETKYWARFRVIGTVDTDPSIEQIKLHTNRFEINKDGYTEYFGRSRYAKLVAALIEPNADKNPPNENVDIADGMTVVRHDNEFANGANDGNIITGLFPDGIDTSIPILLYVDWYPKSDGAGDVELELEMVVATPDFVYDGTATKIVAEPIITSVDTDQYKRITSIFKVIARTALPGDTIYGSLFRNATITNSDDTYAGNIVITAVRVLGHFWSQ